MAVTTLLGLPIPQMSDSVGKTIPDLASAMQMIDEKLGGSRIVDHNLDVVDPPRGYYWRREDGVQVCWATRVELTYVGSTRFGRNIQLPSAFVDTDYSTGVQALPIADYTGQIGLYVAANKRNEIGVNIYGIGFNVNMAVRVSIIAIGTWK